MMKKKSYNHLIFFIGISGVIILLDQILKYLVLFFQPEWDGNFLTIHLVKNTGAGFGILPGATFWLGLISAAVAGIILFNYRKIPQEMIPQLLFALFLGGVVGNLLDRLFRGYVIDFIDFKFWPAFNVADMAITISVMGLILYYWKK